MSYDENVELINGYNEWVIQRRVLANDVTPEAYLKAKMEEDAGERLLKAVEYISDNFGEWNQGNGWYEDTESDDVPAQAMRAVEKILRGYV